MALAIALPKLEGNIAVSDDRQIGFAEFGNPQGRAVFWLHGTPGARRQIPTEARVYAEETNMRLIGTDRPGIASSTPHQYDAVRAFADDSSTIADMLGIEKMAVVGLSGGGSSSTTCSTAAESSSPRHWPTSSCSRATGVSASTRSRSRSAGGTAIRITSSRSPTASTSWRAYLMRSCTTWRVKATPVGWGRPSRFLAAMIEIWDRDGRK